MQFTTENKSFYQCGFNFYVGDIDDESTIIFREDFIIIGNINTSKNIFAMGELIVLGEINCKSLYADKDLLCIGNVNTDQVEVEGKYKLLTNEDLQGELFLNKLEAVITNNDGIQAVVNESIANEVKTENTKCSVEEDESSNLNASEISMDIINEISDQNLLYEKYISKKGDIVSGKVTRFENNKYIIKLDDIEAEIFTDKENNFSIGDTSYSYIKSVFCEENNLKVILANNDRSFIIKILKMEMEKNKYDFGKVFIKEIIDHNLDQYIVYINSEQHTQSTLDIIETKLKKYLNGKDIKLYIYGSKNNIIRKDVEDEINKNLDIILHDKEKKIKETKSIADFHKNDIINHKTFGVGKIISMIDKDTATIDFNGTKKNIKLTYLLDNGSISREKSNVLNIVGNNKKNISDKSVNTNVSKSKLEILNKYEQKKFTLVDGIVLSINDNYIRFNINNEAIGILRRENDCVPNKVYKIGEQVICYISNVYIKEDKVEIQIYRNTSNFFKLLFNKYKEELDLKKCNLKLCKFTKSLGARLVVERKNGFNDDAILEYVNELINKDAGGKVAKIIALKYSPYIFLSELFDLQECSVRMKHGKYYLYNVPKENEESVDDIIEELNKVISYKISINV